VFSEISLQKGRELYVVDDVMTSLNHMIIR